MKDERLDGLVAATYTPLDDNGAVNATVVGPIVEHLLGSGINGLYVCGSTGEGMSLSSDERKIVAEAYVQAAEGRVPVIVQVGHNSLAEAQQLTAHAQEIGADMISATCPSYFKVGTVAGLVDCMAGSTYNIAAPLYHRIIVAFDDGNLNEARRLQALSVKMIRTLNHFPFHPAMKAVIDMQGFSMGGCRLPQGRLSDSDANALRGELDAIGFFKWSNAAPRETLMGQFRC